VSDNPTKNVVDFINRGVAGPPSIAERIARRKALLTEWLKDGIPPGKRDSLPGSLSAARKWNDAELGIAAIASPNDFTKSHPVHGEQVRQIARLLLAIDKRYGRPKNGVVKSPSATVAKFDREEADLQLTRIVAQWHAERHERLVEQKRADAAEQRCKMLLIENAELTRKLGAYDGLKVVR